jgi:hypothetical protein
MFILMRLQLHLFKTCFLVFIGEIIIIFVFGRGGGQEEMAGVGDLLRMADKALYLAKTTAAIVSCSNQISGLFSSAYIKCVFP